MRTDLPIFDAIITSPVGFLGMAAQADTLTRIEFLGVNSVPIAPSGAFLREAAAQLMAYFADPTFTFSVPYRLEGTDFRQKVWLEIAAIPCGEVRSYADIACALHTAPRPVGGACGANPLPVLIPCHRVVAANGLGGFNAKRGGQDWLPIKRWLLNHEQAC